MSDEKEPSMEEFIVELDKMSPQHLLNILNCQEMHPDIRFEAAKRPHMNKEKAEKACELIAKNRKETAYARVLALRSLASRDKAVEIAKGIVLDRTETHEVREEALFYFPHTENDAAELVGQIFDNKAEEAWFRGTIAGKFTRWAIEQGIVSLSLRF